MKKLAVDVNMFNKQYLYNIVSFFSVFGGENYA